MTGDGSAQGDSPRYFSTPAEAVREIRSLLEARDWSELSRYYDLSGTGVERERLTSGEFFFDPDEEAGHPVDRGWRAPFPPSYRYVSHRADGDEVIVEVAVGADQGDGTVNRGVDTFRMRRHPGGLQLVPPAD